MERRHAGQGVDATLLEGLSPAVQELLLHLLMYKTIFAGEGFRSLARREDDPRVQEELLRIVGETAGEAVAASYVLREWDGLPLSDDALASAVAVTRVRLVEDLLRLKEGSTEVFLAAAMRAPTSALRERLLKLAALDRDHADALRKVMGTRVVAEQLNRPSPSPEDAPVGAHAGRAGAGSLTETIRRALAELRRDGAAPARLVVSAAALRHLRDEESLDEEHAEALGVPLDVDFGWRGECFAFLTRERVSYAEILTPPT